MSHFISRLKKNIQIQSRTKKIEHFYNLCGPGNSILDVGVYPELLRPDSPKSVNFFLKNFRYDSKFYTGLGIEGMEELHAIYPGKRFVQYPGDIFPFNDNEFDWVFSNAVIEHVGDYKAQVLFIKEMNRVGKNVFFTTPNKFFPIDSHTMVFFIHWNDFWFYKWRKRKNKWMPKEALNLISKSILKKQLMDAGIKNHKIYSNFAFGVPIPMTFTVIIRTF